MLAKLRLQENKDEKMENKNIKKKRKNTKGERKVFRPRRLLKLLKNWRSRTSTSVDR